MTDGAASDAAPWVWDRLADGERQANLRELAAWVSWLQDAYESWVTLPVCWSRHEALVTELTMFWYWHRYVMTQTSSPPEGVRWHTELRRAADAWRATASCEHEEPVRHHLRLAEQRREHVRRHLEIAAAASGDAGWRTQGSDA